MDNFISSNIVLVSILLYIFFFILIFIYKPHFFYNHDGSLKQFGIGYKNKTILPIWLFFIILGILSYLIVIYYCVWLKFF
jgi:hypothetical protein